MGTPITWRDIRTPDFGRANSLLSNATRTFDNAFTGLDKLQESSRLIAEQQKKAQEEQAANAIFGRIAAGENPANIQADFSNLGSLGGAVASYLGNRVDATYDNANTQASTVNTGLQNQVFIPNNNNKQAYIQAQTVGQVGKNESQSIQNKYLEPTLQQDIQLNDLDMINKTIGNERAGKELQIFNKFGESNAQSENTILTNKATDSGTFTRQYGAQLAGQRGLVNAQSNNANASAALNREKGKYVGFDSKTRRMGAIASLTSAATGQGDLAFRKEQASGNNGALLNKTFVEVAKSLDKSTSNMNKADLMLAFTTKVKDKVPNADMKEVSSYASKIFSGYKQPQASKFGKDTLSSLVAEEQTHAIGINRDILGGGKFTLDDNTVVDTSKIPYKDRVKAQKLFVPFVDGYSKSWNAYISPYDFSRPGFFNKFIKEVPQAAKLLGIDKADSKGMNYDKAIANLSSGRLNGAQRANAIRKLSEQQAKFNK